MAKTTRPCPFCGEEIKVDAAKCRFCGEYLEDDDDEYDDEDEDDDGGGAMKWVAPVGRSGFAILAGYLGILALVPTPFILYGFFGSEVDIKRTTGVVEVGAYINMAVGGMAVLLGLIAIIMVFTSSKGGLGRAIFAILSGVAGAIGYWVLINSWFIPTVIDVNRRHDMPEKVKQQLEKTKELENQRPGK
jgi:hypothetical protein